MKIVIAGASGFIGSALVPRLRDHGHEVTTLVRRAPASANEVQWDPATGTLAVGALDGADAVINLAGEPVSTKWTDAAKQRIVDSRVQTSALLATTMAAMADPPAVFLAASAAGYYGDTGDRAVDETEGSGDGFLAGVTQRQEAATEAARRAGVRVVNLRTGIVLSAKGGGLPPQLRAAKMGLGGRLGSGKQYQSWIALDDELGAIEFLLTADISGPVNLTAPNPVTQRDLSKAIGRAVHRPAVAGMPRWMVSAMLGGFGKEVVLAGPRALPNALLRGGYTFVATDIDAGLRSALAD